MDYYKLLDIQKGASPEEVKKAYLKLAHKYHPDKGGGDEKKFKEINEAYQVLGNAEKRKQYDQFGRVHSNAGFGGGQGFPGGGMGGFNVNFDGADGMGDISDIFEMFFNGGGKKRRSYNRGGDLEMTTTITLEEAKHGKKIETGFETMIACKTCKGAGHDASKGFDNCSYCGGRGEVSEKRQTFFGNFSQVTACPKCAGSGHIPKAICSACKGAGRTKGERNVSFDIRPAIEDGQIIKIKGVGESGEHGMEAGDLYVKVHIKHHHVFDRRGHDLHIKSSISLVDALLGHAKEIKNLDGKMVSFSIPAGFDLTQEIRIKGEGMTGTGDLVVHLEPRTPKHISAKAKKLLEDLEKEL